MNRRHSVDQIEQVLIYFLLFRSLFHLEVIIMSIINPEQFTTIAGIAGNIIIDEEVVKGTSLHREVRVAIYDGLASYCPIAP